MKPRKLNFAILTLLVALFGCSHAQTLPDVEQTCDYIEAPTLTAAFIESSLWKPGRELRTPLFRELAGDWTLIGRYSKRDVAARAARLYKDEGLTQPFRTVRFSASTTAGSDFEALFTLDATRTLGPYPLNEIAGKIDSINSEHYGFVQGEGDAYLSYYDVRIARNRNFIFLSDGHEYMLLRKKDCVAERPKNRGDANDAGDPGGTPSNSDSRGPVPTTAP